LPVETEAIISHLEVKEKQEGLAPLFKFYLRLLRIQLKVEQKLASRLVPSLTKEAIDKRTAGGTPLISFDELALDKSLLAATFAEVVNAFAEYPELVGEIPGRLKEPGVVGGLLTQVIKAWFDGVDVPELVLGEERDQLLGAIIHTTLKPFLVSHAKTMRGSIDQERWRRGYCPVCGGRPDFSYLDKERGSRWLMCARCDTEWLFQRLDCPFCRNQEQSKLGYFVDESGLYRLYLCEKCKRYLKTIDLRPAKEEVLLSLERLSTLDLDRQAKEQGYTDK